MKLCAKFAGQVLKLTPGVVEVSLEDDRSSDDVELARGADFAGPWIANRFLGFVNETTERIVAHREREGDPVGSYWHDDVCKEGFYDSARRIFIGQGPDGGFTTVITDASQAYGDRLLRARP